MISGCKISFIGLLILNLMQGEVRKWNSNKCADFTRITSQFLNYWFEEDQVKNNMPGEIYQ